MERNYTGTPLASRRVGNLAAIEFQNEQPKRRGEIAVPALRVDLANQIRQRHPVTVSDPLQALPEGVLNTHASRATAESDWATNYRGFHADSQRQLDKYASDSCKMRSTAIRSYAGTQRAQPTFRPRW
jgi:hypothetical protein